MASAQLPLKRIGGHLMQELCKDSSRSVRGWLVGALKQVTVPSHESAAYWEALLVSFWQLARTLVPFPLGFHMAQASYLAPASCSASVKSHADIYSLRRVCGGLVLVLGCSFIRQ